MKKSNVIHSLCNKVGLSEPPSSAVIEGSDKLSYLFILLAMFAP